MADPILHSDNFEGWWLQTVLGIDLADAETVARAAWAAARRTERELWHRHIGQRSVSLSTQAAELRNLALDVQADALTDLLTTHTPPFGA